MSVVTSELPCDLSVTSFRKDEQESKQTRTEPVLERSSPTASGPDSDIASVEDLPADGKEGTDVAEEISSRVTAGANYIGTFFSAAWNKTTKTASDATTGSSAFFSSALNKVGGTKVEEDGLPDDADEKEADRDKGKEGQDLNNDAVATSSNEDDHAAFFADSTASFFSNAWNKVGELTKSSLSRVEKQSEVDEENLEPLRRPVADPVTADDNSFFGSISSMVNKVAHDAGVVIKEKVSTSIVSEFNREQEEFIKSRANADTEDASPSPWVGYKDEEGLKIKILSLSEDRRTFLRAPPSGVAFDFDYTAVYPVALSLLKEDTNLKKMRYDLVPKIIKEDDFWKNYFYRVNLIKQSFDLNDLESSSANRHESSDQADDDAVQKRLGTSGSAEDDIPNVNSPEDDEFVSDSYQASVNDMAEATESMKKLGVGGGKGDDWEAELEGELNEYEVVSAKEDRGEGSPGWENQIEEMLDAEEDGKK